MLNRTETMIWFVEVPHFWKVSSLNMQVNVTLEVLMTPRQNDSKNCRGRRLTFRTGKKTVFIFGVQSIQRFWVRFFTCISSQTGLRVVWTEWRSSWSWSPPEGFHLCARPSYWSASVESKTDSRSRPFHELSRCTQSTEEDPSPANTDTFWTWFIAKKLHIELYYA